MKKGILGLAFATLAITQQECGDRSTPQEIPAGTKLVEVNTTNFSPGSTAGLPCSKLKMDTHGHYHVEITQTKTTNPEENGMFTIGVLRDEEVKTLPEHSIFSNKTEQAILDLKKCNGQVKNEELGIISAPLLLKQ